MIVWNQSRASIDKSRRNGQKVFKSRGARFCRFCEKKFANPQQLRWHMEKEHK